MYRRWAAVAEFVHACIKSKLGLRQFHVRGLRKVRMEMLWACFTYNVQRYMRHAAEASTNDGRGELSGLEIQGGLGSAEHRELASRLWLPNWDRSAMVFHSFADRAEEERRKSREIPRCARNDGIEIRIKSRRERRASYCAARNTLGGRVTCAGEARMNRVGVR